MTHYFYYFYLVQTHYANYCFILLSCIFANTKKKILVFDSIWFTSPILCSKNIFFLKQKILFVFCWQKQHSLAATITTTATIIITTLFWRMTMMCACQQLIEMQSNAKPFNFACRQKETGKGNSVDWSWYYCCCCWHANNHQPVSQSVNNGR